MEFHSVFCCKLAIFGKIVQLRILSKKLNFFKPRKNSYMEPLCTTVPEYGGQQYEIRSFGQFCYKLEIFSKTVV
jgi:hypothetical protein